MTALLVIILAWPSQWYLEYSSMNWDEMAAIAAEPGEDPGELAALAISLFGTGGGDPLSPAMAAVASDTTDHRGWTALALVRMSPDTVLMDSLFSRAFALAADTDPVLTEIYAYWLLSSSDLQGAVDHSSAAIAADSSFGPAWLTLSMAYMDMGSLETAVDVSRRSLGFQPGSVPLRYQYASALDAYGSFSPAEEAYRAVAELDPGNTAALSDLASLYLTRGMDGKAIKVYRDILEIDPYHILALKGLGELVLSLGRNDLAEDLFSTLLELEPDNPGTLFSLGRIRSVSSPEEAAELLERAVDASPDLFEAWQELVSVYESLDDLSSAEIALEKCVQLAPDPWLYGELGYVRENLGLYDSASEAYQTALEMDDQYLYGWQRRGDIYRLQENLPAASEWFTMALDSLSEPDPWIARSLATVLAEMGSPDSAAVYFRMAVELDPGDYTAWLGLARSLAVTGDDAFAIAALDSCLSLGGDTLLVFAEKALIPGSGTPVETVSADYPGVWVRAGWDALYGGFRSRAASFADLAADPLPDDPWDIISLGELFEELGEKGRREDCYLAAVESPLRTPEHSVSIANYFFDRGMYRESIALLTEEYSSNPHNPDVATALAEAHLFNDNLDTAEAILSGVVSRDPLSVFAICYLGLIEENRGNPSAAADRYLEALRIQPGYGYAEDRLRYISGESYDPARRRSMNRKIDWSLWLDLSRTGGNVDEQNYGGGGSLSFNYGDTGSSVTLETRGTAEIKDDRDLRRTAWASLSAEHFLSRHLYAGGRSSWDRQPLTVRPWQVSSYLAAGWKSWPAFWIWFAPETGAGLVNTSWSGDQGRTDEWTVYLSLSVWAKTAVSWLPSLWISGGVYIPPEDTEGLVANGVGELEFSLPGPLSLIFGTSLDYTRTPVVESWENLDSELYLRLRL